MDIQRFDRIEKKYLITSKQKDAIRSAVKKHMNKDGYHKSEVYNIYFDTANFDLIIKSIDNPNFKEKLRARSYGGYDKVFLEIKTKLKGYEDDETRERVGYKRRVLITHRDFERLVRGEKTAEELAREKVELGTDVQIAREVDYLMRFFDLEPRILVYYDRESYVGEAGLRVTFDENLSFRNQNLSFKRESIDQKYFQDEKDTIMEIKAHGVIPLWLCRTLSSARAYPARFSKIGKIYEVIKKGEK